VDAASVDREQREQPEQLIAYLEPDQLALDKAAPLPRARLRRGTSALLWTLRIAVTVLGAMVIYTFIASLS
jgi:hypothetical protein